MKKRKRKLRTFSLGPVYDDFRKACREADRNMSRTVERFMKEFVKGQGR